MKHHHGLLKGVKRTGMFALVLFVAGCASGPLSTREKGALAGGGLGAATGAIIGSTVGAPGAGAAIGGAAGAAGGALIGDQLQSQEQREAYQQHQLEQQHYDIQRQQRELYEHEHHHE